MVVGAPKVGLLMIALLLLFPSVQAHDESHNAEDGSTSQTSEEPCDAVKVRLEWPYVDVHPECIKLPPSWP